MKVRRLCQAALVCRLALGALLITAVTAAVALASASLPHTAKAYDTGRKAKRVSLTLVISASNPKQILAGPTPPPVGSQFALSVGSIQCPHVTRNPGLPRSSSPFMLIAFPGATLRLSHGSYGFSKSSTVRRQVITGSPTKPFELKLKFTGSVVGATKITGTIAAHGGPCSPKGELAYTATLDPKLPVAPGE
jgi:hypothetical protein